MNKKYVLLIRGNSERDFAMKTWIEMGRGVIVIDTPISNPTKIADYYLFVRDIFNSREVILNLENFLNKNKNIEIECVYCFYDANIEVAVDISRHINTPFMNQKQALTLSNKSLFRNLIKDTNPQIKYKIISENSKYYNDIDYPIVVKPTNRSGSQGVKQINNNEEFINHASYLFSLPRATEIIIESYIFGIEHSAEVIILDENNFRIMGIFKKNVTSPPYFVELEHTYLGDHLNNSLLQDQLNIVISNIIKDLELSRTIIHIEFKSQEGKINIIECNPRIAGDYIPDLLYQITGINLYKEYIDLQSKNYEFPNNYKTGKIGYVKFAKSEYEYFNILSSLQNTQNEQIFRLGFSPTKGSDLMNNEDRRGYFIVLSTDSD